MKYVIMFIGVLLLSACNPKKETEEKTATRINGDKVTFTDAQMKNAGILTGKMEQKEMAATLKVNGKIDVPPQNMVSVSVPLGGYLKNTSLLPGMHIAKGEIIAVIEDQQYIQMQQDYLTARVKIHLLENEYLRQKELNSSRASSDKVFQQAEADYKSAQVLLTALGEKLKLAGINPAKISENSVQRSVNIYSPIDGYVSKVNVNIGKYISPTDVLFELVNPTDIHLALKVYEKDLDKIFIGQKLLAYTNNQPDKKYPCEIILIGKDLSADRNTEVHCHFETYEKALLPGTYMNALIEVKSKMSFVLPEDAVVYFENKNLVFIKTGHNEFEMMPVTVGNAENGLIEVENPSFLTTKEIVKQGAYSLLMSLKNKSEQE